MFLTGDIERFGTGTLDMYRLAKERGLHSPEFNLDEGFKVTIWRPSAKRNNKAGTGHDTGHDDPYNTDAKEETIYFEIENPAHRLVFFMEGEMGRPDMMERLDLKHRESFMNNYLNPALDEKWIEMTLPDKPTSRNQKYRLTRKGKKLQQSLKEKHARTM